MPQASPKRRVFTEKHPFFEGLSDISDDKKSFFDELFSIEGDIFGDCSADWVQMRDTIIKRLFNSAQQLEEFMILEVPPQILSKVQM